MRRFEPDLAAVFVNRSVRHHRGRAVPGDFVKKLRSFGARLRACELAFDRENVLAQPREQFAFAAGDGRILRQMRVTVDEARENRRGPVVDPAD